MASAQDQLFATRQQEVNVEISVYVTFQPTNAIVQLLKDEVDFAVRIVFRTLVAMTTGSVARMANVPAAMAMSGNIVPPVPTLLL